MPSTWGTASQPLRRAVRSVALVALATTVFCPVAAAYTREQLDNGAWVYRRQCARCHGGDGQGKDDAWKGLRAPELIGAGALPVDPRPYQQIRRRRFHTAQDVYWFTSASMPADQPASLEPEEYWDVIAYLLRSNGIAPDGKPLSDETAAQVALPSAEAGESAGKVGP
jgi:mono/diheme cytochrome c family protein